MRYVGAFTPQAVPSGNFDLTVTQAKVLFSNESCSNLLIKMSSGFSFKLPAGGNRLLCIYEQNSNISYSTLSQLNIPCIDAVDVEVYDLSETIVEVYPTSMARQTTIGNGVQLGTAANQLVNTGNNPGTNIITARPNDVAVGNTWIADNSGNLIINSDNVGALTRLLQLIAGATPKVNISSPGVLTEVFDKLQIDNDAFVNGNHALGTGGLLFSTLANAFGLSITGQSSLDNGAIFTNGSGGITVVNINFSAGSLSRIKFGVANNVTNAGQIVIHGLGVAPDVVFCTLDNVGVGEVAQAALLNATNFTISTSGTSSRTVWWLALKA
jgi:hypothetical protein